MTIPVEVIVSGHARQAGAVRGADERTIRREVLAALQEGRKAKTKPRWTTTEGRRGKGQHGARYCWNEEQTRAYVYRYRDGRVFVITVLQGREQNP